MKTAITFLNRYFITADDTAQITRCSCSELHAVASQKSTMSYLKADIIGHINVACIHIDTSLSDDIAAMTRRKLMESVP